jgi:translation initiation factor 2B subunit (eIF-2B alpha/beta/delta family)
MYKQKLITKDLKDYLIPKVTQPGKVQGNPKIHKKNHPFRTIINGSNHATEKMAKVVEQELSENVRNLNTYIKDTTDFLQKLNNISQSLPNETIMFCLDVKALYPSVPRIEATSACKIAFENRTTKTISRDSVQEMMDLVLENNNLRFDN